MCWEMMGASKNFTYWCYDIAFTPGKIWEGLHQRKLFCCFGLWVLIIMHFLISLLIPRVGACVFTFSFGPSHLGSVHCSKSYVYMESICLSPLRELSKLYQAGNAKLYWNKASTVVPVSLVLLLTFLTLCNQGSVHFGEETELKPLRLLWD